jgi:hypothetical protein
MNNLFSIAAVFAILWSTNADAEYLTYSEWASLPSAARAYYLSGSFDALTGVVNSPTEKYQKHYVDCVRESANRKCSTSGELARIRYGTPGYSTAGRRRRINILFDQFVRPGSGVAGPIGMDARQSCEGTISNLVKGSAPRQPEGI